MDLQDYIKGKQGYIVQGSYSLITEDAQHLAIATLNNIDALVSWNFKHLVNINKERLVIAVNIKEGYNYPLRLTTPMEVMDE